MSRLQTLKSALTSIGQRLTQAPLITSTPRLRGRAGVERRERWLQLHPLCCDCEAEGRTQVGHEVDHQVPLWQGGADDESNFATRCRDHHAAKTAREAAARSRAWPGLEGG